MEKKINYEDNIKELIETLSRVESLIDAGRDDGEIVPLCEQVTKKWAKEDLEKVREDLESRTDSQAKLEIADFLNYRVFPPHSKNVSKEICSYIRMAAEHPEEPQVRAIYQMGCLKYNFASKPDPEQALRWFSAAAKSYPDAFLMIGTILVRQQQFEAAEANFRKGLAIRPDDYETLTALAALCVQHKSEKAEALQYLHRAVRANPHGYEARELLEEYFPDD